MNRAFWLRSLALAVPVVVAMHGGNAGAQGERVGKVTTVQPATTIAPPGQQPAIVDVNSAVSMADIVRTDISGFVKIEFNDGSMLTVNPGSSVTIDQYVYNRSTSAGALIISVGSGVARFVSGNMRKEDIKIKTSSATLGLRGTDIVIRSDGVSSEIEVLDGSIALIPCRSQDVYVADKGQIIGVDYSCAISIGPAGVSGGASATASAAAAAPGDPGDPGGPSGGPGNGNGNTGNAGNGGGNTGGSGPGTGNGDNGTGNGGTGGGGAGGAGGGAGGSGGAGGGAGGSGGAGGGAGGGGGGAGGAGGGGR